MAKRWNKALAFALALCMCAGSMNVSAWATTTTETVNNGDGTTTAITTTTEEKTDAEKNLTVTVTVEKATDGTTTDGVKVDRDEKRVDTTTTSEDGDLLGESWEEGGKETKKWSEEIKPGEDVPPVSAPVTPDDPTTKNVNEGKTSGEVHSKTEETTGDTDKSDGEWDFTTTTTEIDRKVDVTTSEVTVTESEKTDVDLEPVAPEIMKTEKGFENGYYEDGTKKNNIFSENAVNDIYAIGTLEWDKDNQKFVVKNWSGEGDYRYGGWGEQSTLSIKTIEYDKDEQGNLIASPNINDYPVQFTLHDADGNMVFAYCVDLETGAARGSYYNVSNLEDSDYYASEASEEHIRAIVTNGYWGASNDPDKDGNLQTGSLAKIKDDLKKAFENGTLKDEDITIQDGEETKTIKLSDLMQGLTEGEALAVTQAAIWTYANGSGDVQNGKASEVVVGADGFVGGNQKRLATFYNYMINLTEPKHTETTVIDKDTFIAKDGLNLVIGDKVGSKKATDEEGKVLKDEAGNDIINDVYEASLNFTLEFKPSRDKDDLLVTIKYTDLDGKEQSIIKRLAGTDDGENKYIEPNEDGSYTIDGLKLSENENWTFNIELSGTQKLEQGVYVYSPVGGRGSSQTMIGMGEGTKSVDVQASVTVNFSVDESKKVTTVREWHDESDPVWTPTEKPEYPEDDEQDDDKDIPDEDVPLVDIPDEEIPLASVPQTGVNNTPWSLMVAAAGLALAAVLGKKNK